MSIPKSGITADRKSKEKEAYIIFNYGKIPNKEICAYINETPRWLKRQLRLLKDSGKIVPARKTPEIVLSSEDWSDALKSRIIELKSVYFKSFREVTQIIKQEFGIDLPSYTYCYWFSKKFGFKSSTKKSVWLSNNVPTSELDQMLNAGLTLTEIGLKIKEKYGVYVSDDVLLVYLRSIGFKSQKVMTYEKIQNRAKEFPKDWIDSQIRSRVGFSTLASKMGTSKAGLRMRLNELDLEMIDRRISWSASLDSLRETMLSLPPMNKKIPPDLLKQMVLGWLLGDGSLDTNGRFVVNHSLKQLDYLYLKYQVFRDRVSNIVTVPRSCFSGEGTHIGGKEQIGISCPGFEEYLPYLKKDGTKDHEKIMSELSDLGWACYFMDDGCFFSEKILIVMKVSLAKKLKNRFIFGDMFGGKNLIVKSLNIEYIIPSMSYKVPDYSKIGKFWEQYFPELYRIDSLNSDFDLCRVSSYLVSLDDSILNKSVEYYHRRGFPYFKIKDEYLRKEWDKLCIFNISNMVKEDGSFRNVDVGNNIYKHFMQHIVEAKYRGVSPHDTFKSYMSLRSTLEYCLKTSKSILPDFVYNSLMFFNGGVTGFPCSLAKAVVEMFSQEGAVVVDPCAGWGGRLLGTVSAKRVYCGFEPWDKTYNALKNMIDFFQMENTSVVSSKFDPFKAPKQCDLVMTSPPYIDLEVYGQSFGKQDWDSLLENIFQYSEKHLKKGGYLVLNVTKFMKGMMPATALKEVKAIYWHSSPRKRNVSKSEVLYVWQK